MLVSRDSALGRPSPLPQIDLSLLADQVGESPPQTLDRSHGVHDLLLSVNVGVQHTQNVLEVFLGHQRLQQEGNSLEPNH